MFKNIIKNSILLLIIVLILLVITIFNQFVLKNSVNFVEYYNNELAIKIANNDVADVDYNFLNDDLTSIDEILTEQLSLDLDIVKKSKYYNIAQNIYSHKIFELLRILNDKLDEEDFNRLEIDIDDFYKNIDFAISDIKNTLESSIDIEYYTNKYLYEEKQKKCREILETYKGFLQ